MSPAAHSCPRTAARACATGFVKRFRRRVQRMRGFVQIVDDDDAGLEDTKAIYHIRYLFVLSRQTLVYAYLELHTKG